MTQEHTFSDGTHTWRVPDLWAAAVGEPVVEMSLGELEAHKLLESYVWTRSGDWTKALTVQEVLDHARRVDDADLSCPIILTPEGRVADGTHRIVKALRMGRRSILAVRLPLHARAQAMNYPCYQINVLTAIEGLRKRPTFYVSAKNPELGSILTCRVLDFVLVWAGLCEVTHLEVKVDREHRVTIQDNGQGLPIERERFSDGRHPFEVWLSEPSQTARQEAWLAVGLSTRFTLETVRHGRRWALCFEDGKLVKPLTDEGPAEGRGTTLTFQLDPEFVEHAPDRGTLAAHLAARAPKELGFNVGRVDGLKLC